MIKSLSSEYFKRLNSFKILLLIIIIGSVLLIAEKIPARPDKTKNEFHRNCTYCHFPNDPRPIDYPIWNEPGQSRNIPGKAPEITNKIHSSRLCLGCHDGTIASDHAFTPDEGKSPDSFGMDTGKGHPVSVDYMTAFSKKGPKKLHHPSTIGSLKLYDGKIECGTCHDTHQSFRLRISMSRSELCFRCHNM